MSTNPRPVSTTTPPTSQAMATRRPRTRRPAFTLTEIMIVVAIIAILAVVVAWAGSRVLSDAKVKQTHSLMNSLKAAMAECQSSAAGLPPPAHYYADVPLPPHTGKIVLPPFYKSVRTDYYRQKNSGHWEPDTSPTANYPNPPEEPIDDIWAVPDGTIKAPPAKYDSNQTRIYGIQVLYFRMMQEPRAKQILGQMSTSTFARATTLKEYFSDQVSDFVIGDRDGMRTPHETQAILDAWGRPLYYGWDDTGRRVNNGQPYLQSAGPDGIFDTDDDVLSYKE